MTNTLKYKATERYSTGWTDPRVVVGGLKLHGIENQELVSWTLEQLRNAWLVRFGTGWVQFKELSDNPDKDYMDIGILLDRTNQLETSHDVNTFFPLYRLKQCK